MKTNTGVRIHLGAMSRALNQSGGSAPPGPDHRRTKLTVRGERV